MTLRKNEVASAHLDCLARGEQIPECPPLARREVVHRDYVSPLSGDGAPEVVKHCQVVSASLPFRASRDYFMPDPSQTPAPDSGLQSASSVEHRSGKNFALLVPRRFEFARDSFAFANELHWAYCFNSVTGKTTFSKRHPTPSYAHRCFVLTRAARQFLYHARFDPDQPGAADETCRRLIREVMKRNPRTPCTSGKEVVIPGYASLREFSRTREALLKSECGGAWQSYVLRSHWRMVFPISRAHQARTVEGLLNEIRRGNSPIVHLVRFPKLTINHGMVLFGTKETEVGVCFQAYDPNDPEKPTQLLFDRATRIFSLPANQYWAGGRLDVIEIYRGWLM